MLPQSGRIYGSVLPSSSTGTLCDAANEYYYYYYYYCFCYYCCCCYYHYHYQPWAPHSGHTL